MESERHGRRTRRNIPCRGRFAWAPTTSGRVRAVLDGAVGRWSEDALFRTVALRLGSPQPVAPTGGVVVGRRPDFVVRNGTIEGEADGVFVEIRVAVDSNILANADSVGRSEVDGAAGQETAVTLNRDVILMADTEYVWQARAVATVPAGTVASSWSAVASFRTVADRLGAPELVAPIDGAAVGVRPVFAVRNGLVEGDVEGVRIEVRVSSGSTFRDEVFRAGADAESVGQTSVRLARQLVPGTRYYWQARAVGLVGGSDRVVSPWSDTAEFRTDDVAPLGPARIPPPHLLHVLRQVAAEHPEELRASFDVARQNWTGNFEFLDLAVEALRKADGARWGFTHWISYAPDLVGYYRGTGDPQGSTNVVVIDIIAGRPGGERGTEYVEVDWFDATEQIRTNHPEARGEWRYPRR